jgi:hypothetical protein
MKDYSTQLLEDALFWHKNTTAILKALEGAHTLISDPKAWTTKTIARDATGFDRHAIDKRATCFCLIGALTKAAYDMDETAYTGLVYQCTEVIQTQIAGPIAHFNDTQGHAAVLELLSKAIGKVKTYQEDRNTKAYAVKVA